MRNTTFKFHVLAIVISLIFTGCSSKPIQEDITNDMCSDLKPITVHMIGDSTMANKKIPNDQNERGWGQIFAHLFSSEATIANAARNGRSSKSFIDEGLWQKVKDKIAPGDWLIIQFGHNDQKPDHRHTEAFKAYSDNLTLFANTAREVGAYPVIATSIVRGEDFQSHGEYPKAAKQVAQKLAIPLIDLEAKTLNYVKLLSDQKTFYVQKDSTHLNAEGARIVAEMAVKEIKRMKLPLGCFIP